MYQINCTSMPHPLYTSSSHPTPNLVGPRNVPLLLRGIQWCLLVTYRVRSTVVCTAYTSICSVQPQFPFHRISGAPTTVSEVGFMFSPRHPSLLSGISHALCLESFHCLLILQPRLRGGLLGKAILVFLRRTYTFYLLLP